MDKKIPTESLQQYYERWGLSVPAEVLQGADGKGHFNIRAINGGTQKTPFNRRDYYKICICNLGRGDGMLIYNDQEIPLDQTCLIFTHPSVPTSIEVRDGAINRFHCLFNKPFIEGHLPPDVQYASALFNPALHPVIVLSKKDADRLIPLFAEMQSLRESDYPFKWDMIRNILQLLVHEGIRLQQGPIAPPSMVRDRLVNVFLTTLNQQFPVDSPENSLKLLTPAHFAEQLHVHVNHLNSVVKKHTGKTTRAIIQERVITEARALLRNTNWNIAEIAYALGFEYPSHFNKYFKHFTTETPMEFRAGQQLTPATHL
jgi:AraC family transcriptional activator of pobA